MGIEDIVCTYDEDDEFKPLTKEEVLLLLEEAGSSEKLNLSGMNLSGINLSALNLTKANLRGIDLSNADLEGANLS
jgi:pentapeptide repeat protein